MALAYRSAIITGASSGIGAELARHLAAQGVPVGLTARRGEALAALADAIRQAGGTAALAAADAADREATHAAIAALTRTLGPVDLLVANAGLGEGTSASGFDARSLQRMVGVNLLGAAYAIEVVLPPMIQARRGQIVGVSSIAAYRGIPGSAGYCATKAALSSLLEGLRPELRLAGVDVTTVHPGFIDTPMTERGEGPQPFKMGVERAARIILRGIAARRREVNFPGPMVALMAVLRHLPPGLADRILTSRVLNQGRPSLPTREGSR